MKITTRPSKGESKIGDLVIIKQMTPDLIKVMAGRQKAYFLGIKVQKQNDVKIYCEVEPPKNAW